MKDNLIDPDSPLWEPEDFARARPASEALPPNLVSLLLGQPAVGLKAQVARQEALARGFRIAA